MNELHQLYTRLIKKGMTRGPHREAVYNVFQTHCLVAPFGWLNSFHEDEMYRLFKRRSAVCVSNNNYSGGATIYNSVKFYRHTEREREREKLFWKELSISMTYAVRPTFMKSTLGQVVAFAGVFKMKFISRGNQFWEVFSEQILWWH